MNNAFPNNFLTKTKFLSYQKKFYTSVVNSNLTCTIRVDEYSPISDTSTTTFLKGFTKTFTGSSNYETGVNCLYERTLLDIFSNNQGIGNDGTIDIYISPLQIHFFGNSAIKTFFGNPIVDLSDKAEYFKLTIEDLQFQVTNIIFEGRVFDSCVAIKFTCKLLDRA